MGLVCLPIHVWDTELESRIWLAVLAAENGHDVLLGHEYNIARMYENSKSIYCLHNGRPTNTYRSKKWRNSIQKNNGFCGLVLEEGLSDLSMARLQEEYIGVTKDSLELVDRIFTFSLEEKHNVKHILDGMNLQLKHQESSIEPISNIRIEMLGELGKFYFQERYLGLKNFFGEFALVSDNFGCEQFGSSSPMNQAARNAMLSESTEELKLLESLQNKYSDETHKIRNDFCKVINQLATNFPSKLFVVRPASASDPKFWHENLKRMRNIHVISRDCIEPWIFAAKCVIHSGCTSGLFSEVSGKQSIDITNLINDSRFASSMSCTVSSFKPSTYDELVKSLPEAWKSEDISNSIESQKLNTTESKLKANLLTLDKQSLKSLSSIHGVPLISSLEKHITSINNFFIRCDIDSRTRHKIALNQSPPNPNKSRHYSKEEILSRIRKAFQILSCTKPIKIQWAESANVALIRQNK